MTTEKLFSAAKTCEPPVRQPGPPIRLPIRTILDSVTDGFIFLDLHWRFVYANKEAERLLGMPRDILIGRVIWQVFPVCIGSDFDHHYHKAMTENTAVHFESFSDAIHQWLEVHAYPSADGLSVYFRDITDRKQAEARQRQASENFFTIFRANPIPMVIEDMHARAVDVNKAFEEMIEHPCEDILGATAEECNVIIDSQEDGKMRLTLEESGTLRNIDRKIRTRTGKVLNVLYSANTIVLDGRKLVLGALVDVTREKELETEMARLGRLDLIGQMAAGISHEIRNPMTTVRGFLQMLLAKPDCAAYREYYEVMISELDRANAIISEFLSVAKTSGGGFAMLNLNHILSRIEPLLQADALKHGVNLRFRLGNTPDILLNDKEIYQLVLNLVRNGFEAMPSGGLLTVRTCHEGGEVVLTVKDQGPGIDKAILDRLGTPFLTTKATGTGLGLAVCYGVVNRHRARMDLDTGPLGTTFRISFPVHDRAAD